MFSNILELWVEMLEATTVTKQSGQHIVSAKCIALAKNNPN